MTNYCYVTLTYVEPTSTAFLQNVLLHIVHFDVQIVLFFFR